MASKNNRAYMDASAMSRIPIVFTAPQLVRVRIIPVCVFIYCLNAVVICAYLRVLSRVARYPPLISVLTYRKRHTNDALALYCVPGPWHRNVIFLWLVRKRCANIYWLRLPVWLLLYAALLGSPCACRVVSLRWSRFSVAATGLAG